MGSINVRLLAADRNSATLTIDVLGVAGSGKLRVQGEQGSVSVQLRKIQDGQLRLDLSGISIKNDLRFSVAPEKPHGVGYVVFRRIMLQRNEN